MIYSSSQMEAAAALDIAQLMCTAARTAPKTRGIDQIETLVITGEDLLSLADKMEEIDERRNGANRTHFTRDAHNVRASAAVVLVGLKDYYYGINCGYCGYANCAECAEKGGRCVFGFTDLGIAAGSAVSAAADCRADTRIMYSVGYAAGEMNYTAEHIVWLGIPVSISGKSPYFDRK